MRFLLIEDHAQLAQTVTERLALDGHGVDHAATLAEAADFLAVTPYDLILLDIMLPDGDGRDFLAAHRAGPAGDTPVIVMTARSDVADRIALLDSGADDYVTKPFDTMELEARIRAVLRRRGGRASPVIRHGDLTFDPFAATLSLAGDDRPRELRNREMRLLEILLSAPDRVHSKAQLTDRLFAAADEVSENAIEVYVARLRRKMEGSSVRIETLRGVGYRLA
ncbi:response regulator transcription factor [Jannaschia pohangensis]|uniref:Two component transcriptional regulator, winged helix family n=1 Tax=Jannaschia pohangensis TaxID=390807 RepID=A0A1I3J4R7_9RHOB|nr:response regulator transcription factor [Jannaschia pohangensis]SFI55193.1 two component transcriptional regulator, winged helix family [Jannaschia pohangensis]